MGCYLSRWTGKDGRGHPPAYYRSRSMAGVERAHRKLAFLYRDTAEIERQNADGGR